MNLDQNYNAKCRDQKGYVRKSNPYLRRTPCVALQLADDDSQGRNVQVMKNHLWPIAFLNAPESESITPKSSGRFSISTYGCMSVPVVACTDPLHES